MITEAYGAICNKNALKNGQRGVLVLYGFAEGGNIAFRELVVFLRVKADTILVLQMVPSAHLTPVDFVCGYEGILLKVFLVLMDWINFHTSVLSDLSEVVWSDVLKGQLLEHLLSALAHVSRTGENKDQWTH